MWIPSWIRYIANAAKAIVKPTATFGIDVSHHQGFIDWIKVSNNKPKVDFAFLKATEGATVADKKFADNVKGCVRNNIRWSAYHFATWNQKDVVTDAKKEADWFIKTVRAVGRPDLPMVLDVETEKPLSLTKAEVLLYITTFLSELVLEGYQTAIYASPGFIESYLPTNHNLGGVRLWCAHYTKNSPRIPKPWKTYWIWQYSDRGQVSGVAGNCDVNRAAGVV